MNNGRIKDAGVWRASEDGLLRNSDRLNVGENKVIAGKKLPNVVPCLIHDIIALQTLIIVFTIMRIDR